MRKPRKPNRQDAITPDEAASTGTPPPARPRERSSRKDLPAAESSRKNGQRKTADKIPAEEIPVMMCESEPKPVRENPLPSTPCTTVTEESQENPLAALPLFVPTRPRVDETIRRHTLAAGAVSLIPLPGADILGLTGIQANMIEEISKVYGHMPTPGWSLRLAGLFALSVGFLDAGRIAVSLFSKFLPGVGSLIGTGGLAAYSAATTYALGKSISSFYEDGGKPEHLIISSLVSSVKKGLEEGKTYWKRNRPGAKPQGM